MTAPADVGIVLGLDQEFLGYEPCRTFIGEQTSALLLLFVYETKNLVFREVRAF